MQIVCTIFKIIFDLKDFSSYPITVSPGCKVQVKKNKAEYGETQPFAFNLLPNWLSAAPGI